MTGIAMCATDLRERIANIPASVQTLRSSAPVVFGHSRASSSKRMSRSQFIEREWISGHISGYISGYISGGGARAISRGEARISAGEMRVLVAHRWVLHPRLEPGVMKSQPDQLGRHGARYVRHARGWYA